MKSIKGFRILSFLEGTSFLVILFVGMPLKYWYDSPEINSISGRIHGGLFVAYVIWAFMLHAEYTWSFKKTTFWILLASIIPFGTFLADKKILSKYN
jgi:integral membrane protein